MKEIKNIVDVKIDEIFYEVHALANTKFGDTTPDQLFQIEKISEELTALVIKHVEQNS